jgi:Na+-transporting NADH:ubiquinone oxidoreductase subunit A
MISIKKGLDLPISGSPSQKISDLKSVRSVALIGFDYVGMKPSMSVQVGDKVKRGQLLFVDKKIEGVRFTAPAAGVVREINRGERRVFQSLVIDVEGDEAEKFDSYQASELTNLSKEKIVDNLVNSGLWTAFRTRPFSRTPAIDSTPSSIFVTAIDTHPLAADPNVVIAEAAEDFVNGLKVLTGLTPGVNVNLCTDASANLTLPENVLQHRFSGPHPAGNAGTHIHFIDPVSEHKTVWTINYQDVIRVGKLFISGELDNSLVISLAGPAVKNPRLVRTVLGANIDDLIENEVKPELKVRTISGSVFGGRTARGPVAWLGRFSQQLSVLEEGDKREFLGWLSPGSKKFSKLNIYLSKFFPVSNLDFTTTTNGSERAMVPVGTYEEVMPLDILPTQLLRSLIVGDVDMAQKLGCLELDEEDLALCTFVCPGKYEYGPILRENLTMIEKEG